MIKIETFNFTGTNYKTDISRLQNVLNIYKEEGKRIVSTFVHPNQKGIFCIITEEKEE